MEALHSGLFQELYSLNEAVRAQDFTFRTQLVLTVALLSAAYLHLFVRRHAPGLKSLLLILPVVVINCWAPLWFDPAQELITRVVLGLLLFWLGNFKVCVAVAAVCVDNHTKAGMVGCRHHALTVAHTHVSPCSCWATQTAQVRYAHDRGLTHPSTVICPLCVCALLVCCCCRLWGYASTAAPSQATTGTWCRFACCTWARCIPDKVRVAVGLVWRLLLDEGRCRILIRSMHPCTLLVVVPTPSFLTTAAAWWLGVG